MQCCRRTAAVSPLGSDDQVHDCVAQCCQPSVTQGRKLQVIHLRTQKLQKHSYQFVTPKQMLVPEFKNSLIIYLCLKVGNNKTLRRRSFFVAYLCGVIWGGII